MSLYLLIPFFFFVLAFIIRMPIGFGMILGSIAYFLAKGMSISSLVNTVCYGLINAYILLAIPLFIFTANVMNSSEVTDKVFDFARSIIGRMHGATAYVNILASLIFAGMTGSAVADASGLGVLEIKQMRKEGYDMPFSCAITASTAMVGPIFPPSIPFVIYAMISGASVGKLFMGGIVPAIILLVGIYSGIITPTEAAAVAACYALLVCAGLTEMFLRFRGYEQRLIDMMENPKETRDILERIADYKIQYWDIVGDYIKLRDMEDSVLVASECDDLGTQQSLLVSPSELSDIVFPPMRRYLGWMKKKLPGCRIFFHCDGSIRSIIPDLIEMGIDILNPVQYSAAGMDLTELKRDFGKELVFWGAGIDTQETLVKGPVHKIRDEVRGNIETLALGGEYVFAPMHNVQADVPPEHFWAMWEAWKEFGNYR